MNEPDSNYIGMIIGPRGTTQKSLEQKSGCKISIRGKGSTKVKIILFFKKIKILLIFFSSKKLRWSLMINCIY